jgi:hypothetical protein
MASRVAYAARFFATRFVAGRTKPSWVPGATPALQGTVMGIARGIADQDNRDAPELLSCEPYIHLG